jgi:hypothetical protein
MTDDDLITAVRDSFTGVHSATPVERIVSRGRAVRARRQIAGTAAALAAVAAVTAGVLTGLPGPRGTHQPIGGAARAAAYVLDRAARAVAQGGQPVPRPGQYILVTSAGLSMTDGGGKNNWLTVERRRIWWPADDRKPGVLRYDAVRNERLPWSAPPPTTRGLGASWLPVPPQGCPDAPPARFTYQFLTTLPTNPAKLRAWIYAHKNGGQGADNQAWTDISDLLGTMLTPPKLTAALFKVAATIPGATVVPHATDAAGRAGIAVARLIQGSTQDNELVFSARTYRLLGERTTLTAPAKDVGPAGTVIGGWAMLSETVVNHLPRSQHGQKGSPSAPSPGC